MQLCVTSFLILSPNPIDDPLRLTNPVEPAQIYMTNRALVPTKFSLEVLIEETPTQSGNLSIGI